MRRADREIKDFEEMLDVIFRCDVCRLGLNDGDYPYILPLNFGVKADKENQLQYKAEQGMCTFAFESIIGHGTIRMLDDENEKLQALKILMDHYYPGENKYFNPAAIPRTAVYSLEVSQMTGKRKVLK